MREPDAPITRTDPAEPDPFTADEFAAWRGMLRVHSTVFRELDRALLGAHGFGIDSYGVLITLVTAPEHRLPIGELGLRRNLTPSGISRSVDRLAKSYGALVNSVEKGGPAEKAGVESGDIILKVDGRTVNSSSELPRIITQIKPGTRIPVQVWRFQMAGLLEFGARIPSTPTIDVNITGIFQVSKLHF